MLLRDWWMVCVVLVVLGTLTAIALINRQPKLDSIPFFLAPAPTVIITGAVTNPGSFTLESDATLGTLLDWAEPLPGADLKGLKSSRRLKDGEELIIPVKPSIRVKVKGAVEREGEYCLDSPAKMGDLLRVVPLSENAQIRSLKKREPLEEGMEVHIPKRKRPKRLTLEGA